MNRDKPLVSTIVLPCFTQPNFLHDAIHALVQNSYYRHRILVVWSDPEIATPGRLGADDFQVDDHGQEVELPFRSVREFLADHAAWLAANGVESLDVTEEAIPFRAKYERGEIFPGKTLWEGGVDCGLKVNAGLAATRTEWAIPLWDCDFHAGWWWDKPIFDYALDGRHEREFLVPMHVQPDAVAPDLRASWDTWRDSPPICCHRLTLPTQRRGGRLLSTEREFFGYCHRWQRRGERIVEPCGARTRLHWLPAVVRAEEVRAAGGYSLQGGGFDLEIDDRLGARGFKKTGFLDSFILHKGFTPPNCPLRKAPALAGLRADSRP